MDAQTAKAIREALEHAKEISCVGCPNCETEADKGACSTLLQFSRALALLDAEEAQAESDDPFLENGMAKIVAKLPTGEGLREALLFIAKECDWEAYRNSDEVRAKCLMIARAALKGKDA